MGEWGDAPPTFDRSSAGWGEEGFVAEEETGGQAYLELIGSDLWVAGMINLNRFRRVSDFVNVVDTFLVLHDVVLLTRTGDSTGLVMPELHVLANDIAVIGQLADDKPPAPAEGALFVEKKPRRLVVLTRSHVIDGDVFVHGDTSIMAFVDATDPRFIPMSDVRVRWLIDRKLAARYPFALLQRTQIQGVVTESIKLGGADETERRLTLLKQQVRSAGGSDRLEDTGSATTSPSVAAAPATPASPSSAPAPAAPWPAADQPAPDQG